MTSSFVEALQAEGPAQDRAEGLGLYAFLIGRWDANVVAHDADGATHEHAGEIHAGWVLEGRAIQDVWILPKRAERRAPLSQLPVTGSWFGTTLRVYDPTLDAWHILWTDPATLFIARQLGRAHGSDIVQEGKTPAGDATLRWRFTDIKPESFHWIGEISADGGRHWRKQVDVFARRSGG
jgi:hypothetical protein